MDKLLSRVGVNITDAPDAFFGLGENSVIGRVGTGISNNVQGFVDIGRDLMTGNLQPFGVGIPKTQPMTTDVLGQEVNPNMSPVDSTPTRDMLTGPAPDPLPQSPSLLSDARTVEVPGAKQTLGETLTGKFQDTFTVENVASTAIDKSFDAVVSTGTAAILDPVLGEDPPEEPMGIAYTPQFQATDYSGITEDPLRADTFADYTQRISTGFDDRGLVSSGGAWNNWMRSNLAV